MPVQGWALVFDIRLYEPPTDALRPIIPDNACTLCITAAAGTEFMKSKVSFGIDYTIFFLNLIFV